MYNVGITWTTAITAHNGDIYSISIVGVKTDVVGVQKFMYFNIVENKLAIQLYIVGTHTPLFNLLRLNLKQIKVQQSMATRGSYVHTCNFIQ